MKLQQRLTTSIALLSLSACGVCSGAQVNSNRVDVALAATVLQSITVAVPNVTVAFGVVTPGTTNAAPLGQNLAITTVWNLNPGQTVKLYAYFDNAASALAGVLYGDLIPTAEVSASFNGGSTQGFTSSSPFTTGTTAMTLYSVPVTVTNTTTTRTDSLALTLNLTNHTTLKADAYAGTLHLQAQAL